MKLISWNLNGRRRQASAQIDALVSRNPDVVALQEVTVFSLPVLRRRLVDGGLTEIADSFEVAPTDFRPGGPRRYGQLTAARYPLSVEAPGRFSLPWPERVLTTFIIANNEKIEIHNVHVPPGSSNGWIKIDVLNGVFNALARECSNPRILVGDFNTPQMELQTGEVVTWAQRATSEGWRTARSVRGRPGMQWDAGERSVLIELAKFDLVDVYRSLHGYASTESSWIVRRGEKHIGRRFDHIFASAGLNPRACEYVHDLRVSGLSDHSPIEAIFAFPKDSVSEVVA